MIIIFTMGPALSQDRQATVHLNRVDSNLYPTNFLNVTVIGKDGRPIEDLKPENFTVMEDEKEQKVLDVVQSDQKGAPIYVALIIDASGSMHGAMDDTKNAAKAFVKQLSANDKVALISFADVSNLECSFTDDKTAMESAIDNIKSFGATALYASIYEALDLFADVEGNKAIVVLTDGRNNQWGTSRECITKSIEKGVPVYTIGLGGSVDRESLENIAMETGGMFRHAPASSDLEEIYKSLASQLKSQLWVKYQAKPEKWPKTAARVSIRLKNTPGAGMVSYLNYQVPLQWWKLISGYVLLEVVLILVCYLLFKLMWQKMGMDPVAATRLAILILFVLTGVWYWAIFFKFVPLLYFSLIGLAQAILLIIPIKMLSS